MPESQAEAVSKLGATVEFRRTYFGPNPYSADPAIVAEFRFDPKALSSGRRRCARIARISEPVFMPPPIPEPCDTPRAITGFLVAWALCALTHHRGFLHTATAFEEDGKVLAAIGFHHERVSREALLFAASLFDRVEHITPVEFTDQLVNLRRLAKRHHPDYQVAFTMQAARAMGVPYQLALSYRKTWQFGWGASGELFVESQGSGDSAIGERIGEDKPAAKGFLHSLGVPAPRHVLVHKASDAERAARTIGYPCVVKPTNGGRSVGVTTDICDLETLSETITKTLEKRGSPLMVESQVAGEVYRILVARGRTAYVVCRAAPHVTGNGVSTVRQLIETRNAATEDARKSAGYIGEIPLDEDCAAALQREGLTFDTVVEMGRKVPLRRIPLLSSGAIYTDVTAQTHPDTLRIAEMITAALRIDNCGIDFLTTDITRPMGETGAVLEVNTMPGLRVPLIAGIDPETIGRLILGDKAARVPAHLFIAPEARLAQVRAAARFATTAGWAIGQAVGVGATTLALQPASLTTGVTPQLQNAAATIARNPFAESLFVAAPLEAIVEHGLPLDRFDAIACLECTPDSAWERVLRAASGTYLETTSVTAALTACGLAANRPRA